MQEKEVDLRDLHYAVTKKCSKYTKNVAYVHLITVES